MILQEVSTIARQIAQSNYSINKTIWLGFALGQAYKETVQPTEHKIAMVDVIAFAETCSALGLDEME